jgi:hypothetical protein
MQLKCEVINNYSINFGRKNKYFRSVLSWVLSHQIWRGFNTFKTLRVSARTSEMYPIQWRVLLLEVSVSADTLLKYNVTVIVRDKPSIIDRNWVDPWIRQKMDARSFSHVCWSRKILGVEENFTIFLIFPTSCIRNIIYFNKYILPSKTEPSRCPEISGTNNPWRGAIFQKNGYLKYFGNLRSK